jgi:hypothetical protein
MAKFFRLVLATSALVPLATGCETPESATGLNPEGPPMIQQVFLEELTTDVNGAPAQSRALAFGSHEAFPMERTHAVTSSIVVNQRLRVVVDELLIGNYLEEIACRVSGTCVVEGGHSRVPEGATPDDIARCAVPNDLLASSCTGDMAVCLNSAGVPCGVLDEDENGSADSLRMIDGQVKLVCENQDLGTRFEVGIDPVASFWQPSGNQVVAPGVDASRTLGPALILVPVTPRSLTPTTPLPLLPSSQTCQLWFADNVTDKEHFRVCAPPNGDIAQPCAGDGDVSAFKFETVDLVTDFVLPANNATNVGLNTRQVLFRFTTTIDPASVEVGDVTVMAGAATVTPDNVTVSVTDNRSLITVTLPAGGLTPSTTYTVTLGAVTDLYGVPPPERVSTTFTTTGA